MNTENYGELDEASLVKLYMDLTGVSEASARSVYMFVNSEEEHKANGLDRWRIEKTEAGPSLAKGFSAPTENERELGIGLFGRQGLAIGVK